MRRFLLLGLLGVLTGFGAEAQSYYFGVKSGLTVGTQEWDQSFQRDPLYRYHFIGFLESYDEDDRAAIFGQLGFHVKGSAIRTFNTTIQLPDGSVREIPGQTIPFEFYNLSLTAGGKQKFALGNPDTKLYYLLGIRGDYNINANLRPDNVDSDSPYNILYPFEQFVNNFTFGATAGGGVQFALSELVGVLLEFTVNPDFTNQYNQPEIPNVINPNPFGSQNVITIEERQISNITFEVSLGLRFLRKVIIVD